MRRKRTKPCCRRRSISTAIISNGLSDNCIEADGGARNIRVFDNICFNDAGGAYSSQTIFGGPAYFVRNVLVTGVGLGAKLSITPAGVLNINNTFVG